VERTVHGFEAELRVLGSGRREHRVGEVLLVPALPPEAALRDVRGVDETVAARQELVAEIVFHQLAHEPALGVPEDQTLAVLLVDREQVELAPETAVVAPVGLLSLTEPRGELRPRGEGGAVDALHLRASGVPFPVGAGQREELEGPEPAGIRNVRSAAEVDER